jgi:tetratricopeptide (TPR) repeat protein
MNGDKLMSSRTRSRNRTAIQSSATLDDLRFERNLFFGVAAVVLVYALLAGLRTVSDLDLGWQLATGRWITQHHSVASTDVFSYTAQGEPWVYPVGAGLFFYAVYLLGGYSLIAWAGALACASSTALLLRRGTIVNAAIAVFAVPLIAARTTPRADMFTVVLFAAFLSILWENYRTGRARLWLLPLLMLVWVNVHFGFAAGLGLIAAYVAIELLEMIPDSLRRASAQQRLRSAVWWLVCTVLVTLANPWGWGIYRALLRQEHANALQQFWIIEWASVPLRWGVIWNSLSLRQTGGAIYVLLAIAILASVVAVLRTRLEAALLLLGSIYPAVRFVRMGAVFACVVVVVGGSVLSEEMPRVASWINPPRLRLLTGTAAVALLLAVAGVRCVDLVTDHHYFQGSEATNFGPGLGWWFPQRAAEFIVRENLPAEVFNTYDEGSYLVWKLGPQRLDYIDGRDTLFGIPRIQRTDKLLHATPDSDLWKEEANRFNINTVIFALGRFDGIDLVRLRDWCTSTLWQPVYLDEVSAVFVRRQAGTEALIHRFPVNCQTAPIPSRPPGTTRAEAFNTWANAAAVLAALGRDSESLAAASNALSVFPDSGFLHWLRGNVLFAGGRFEESEQEYLTAVSLEPNEITWEGLAQTYQKRGRRMAALDAMKHAAQLSRWPRQPFLNLGYMYLATGQPVEALKAFDEATHSAPDNVKTADNSGRFDIMMAQGRSAAWDALGDVGKAISHQEEAARLAPNVPSVWGRLAQLYEQQGRTEDANRAREHATEVASKPSP